MHDAVGGFAITLLITSLVAGTLAMCVPIQDRSRLVVGLMMTVGFLLSSIFTNFYLLTDLPQYKTPIKEEKHD